MPRFANMQFDPNPAGMNGGGFPGAPEPDHAARAAELARENQRLKIEMELSRALGARISGQAASDAARLLAIDSSFNDVAGEVVHQRYGIGAGAIAESFLNTTGSYLLQTKNGNTSAPAGRVSGGWDIERAKRDSEYMQAWRRADEKGFQQAWREMMDGMHRNLRTRGA